MYESRGGSDSERFCVHHEIEAGCIVGIVSKVVTDELVSLTLLVVDTEGGLFPGESLGLAQSLDPHVFGFHHENTQSALRRHRIGGTASQYHAQAAFRKRPEHTEKLRVILGFGVVRKTVEAIMDEAFDPISHALIQTFDEISSNVLPLSDLVDDFPAKETELESLRDETAELGGTRSGKSRKGNTRTDDRGGPLGSVMGPSLDLTVDHLVEGAGGRASHGVTSEPFRSV